MKPLKFHSLLVPKIWGGDAIAALKGLKRAPALVGESFEISALPGQETYCSTEGFVGLTLPALIAKYGAELLGSANFQRYGTSFPLLIKFIDAREALSVQVHPDDAMAREEGMPYGKSEMWYVVGTQPGASLMAGFSEDVDAADYERMVADGTLVDKACHYDTHPGDAFYIPAGTLHSIGAGNLIVEVQQSSGATYRVYDFNRTDERGRRRELHIDQARRALDFQRRTDCFVSVGKDTGRPVSVCRTPYFTTEVLRLVSDFSLSLCDIDSFVALVCYQGSASLTDNEGNPVTLTAGETVLIPASTQALRFIPSAEGFACLAAYV
ncbi:MAG: class I mannose-6-phosphate isomerase [Bacteroidaceae bacterium]|nr:class I mannose-6-phosphate isomerase [Bacteroidaceae bacterium]